MPERFEFSQTISRRQWIDANVELVESRWEHALALRHICHGQRYLVRVAIPVLVVLGGIAGGSLSKSSGGYIAGAAIGLALGCSLFLIFGRPGLIRKNAHHDILDHFSKSELGEAIGTMHIQMDSKGITIRSQETVFRASWFVVHPRFTTNFMSLEFSGRHPLVIPHAACPVAIDSLRGQIEHWKNAHDPDGLQRLINYLKDRDVYCPDCAYELRDHAATVCSECGATLSVPLLMTASHDSEP